MNPPQNNQRYSLATCGVQLTCCRKASERFPELTCSTSRWPVNVGPEGWKWVYLFAVLGLPTAEHWAWSRTPYMRRGSIASSTMNQYAISTPV